MSKARKPKVPPGRDSRLRSAAEAELARSAGAAQELQAKTPPELQRFFRTVVNRELRMVELKKEINGLCAQLGQPPRYSLDSVEAPPAR